MSSVIDFQLDSDEAAKWIAITRKNVLGGNVNGSVFEFLWGIKYRWE